MMVNLYLRFRVRVRRRKPFESSDLIRCSQYLPCLASTLCRIPSHAVTAITTSIGDNLKRQLLAMISFSPIAIRSPRNIWTPQGRVFSGSGENEFGQTEFAAFDPPRHLAQFRTGLAVSKTPLKIVVCRGATPLANLPLKPVFRLNEAPLNPALQSRSP